MSRETMRLVMSVLKLAFTAFKSACGYRMRISSEEWSRGSYWKDLWDKRSVQAENSLR